MRILDSARDSWDLLKQYHTLEELREAVRLEGQSNSTAPSVGLRSACWKAFLLCESAETSTWPRTLLSSRSAYNSLKTHFLRYLESPDELGVVVDPLSENTDSPWTSMQKDEELRAEIQQDVDRCMPENPYFRQPDAQRMLLDILFVFCKLNPDVSYRQGMHELLAPILWVVEQDAIDLGQSSKAMGEDATIKAVFDADHIEHDAFALFSQVMHSAKNFYEQTTHTSAENPIVARSKRIVADLLPQVDRQLAEHLAKLDVAPQIFLMRWIRLLFGREFPFDGMLTIWDVIFAEDQSLEIVDHVALVMLLRIRWDLLEADYNNVLALVLRYPPLEKDFVHQALALDALYLRGHMHSDGGSYVVLKYTGRPLIPINRPVTPPALQRNITAFSGVNAARAALSRNTTLSPGRRPRQGKNIEAILQSTAKNIYARGEQLGIGKVVRSAMDEVHRKAQEIRDSQVPSPPTTVRSKDMKSTQSLANRVQELELRNAQLGKLLEGAVGELWDYEKLLAESKNASDANAESEKPSAIAKVSTGLEKLSAAIAKVQFVQVYLQDTSLPLDNDENRLSDEASNESGQSATDQTLSEDYVVLASPQPPPDKSSWPPQDLPSPPRDTQETLADPSTFEDLDQEDEYVDRPAPAEARTTPDPAPSIPDATTSVDVKESKESIKTLQSPPRPSLAESSYSWMLGQDERDEEKAAGNSLGLSLDKRRERGFLFGDGDSKATSSGSPRRGAGGHRKKTSAIKVVDEEDAFDIGSLKRGTQA